MSLRMQSVTALIAATLMQPACATSEMMSKCSVNGAIAAMPGMDAAAICQRFESDLAAALGAEPVPEDLVVALTVHKRGAIEAVLSHAGTGERHGYPPVLVEVTDRALRADDLAQLARTAAQVLTDPSSNHTAHTTAPLKGE